MRLFFRLLVIGICRQWNPFLKDFIPLFQNNRTENEAKIFGWIFLQEKFAPFYPTVVDDFIDVNIYRFRFSVSSYYRGRQTLPT